jgi:hypothetical protein
LQWLLRLGRGDGLVVVGLGDGLGLVVVGLGDGLGLVVVGLGDGLGLAEVGLGDGDGPQEGGTRMVSSSRVTAPFLASMRPTMTPRCWTEIEVRAMMLPSKVVLVKSVAELPTCQ